MPVPQPRDTTAVIALAFARPAQIKVVSNMRMRVSKRGEILLPYQLRRKLGIQLGDELDVHVEAGRIVLTPARKRSTKAKIVIDPITGLPALDAGPDAPILTSKEVAEIPGNFP